MTNEEVHSAVVRWISQRSGGAKVIKAHQSGPAPALPYIMVNLTGAVELHAHPIATEYAGTTLTATAVIEMEWRFSVHGYGPHPTDLLRPLVSAHKIAQALEPLFPSVTVHEVSQIRNVPDWINNAWQPRAQMELIARGIIRDGHSVDAIENYSIEIARAED